MSNFTKPLSAVLTTTISSVLAAALSQGAMAAENPFQSNELPSGYQLSANQEAKCGAAKSAQEAKCGAEKTKAEAKCGAAKSEREGNCGESKPQAKAEEGKCGEAKCGANKK